MELETEAPSDCGRCPRLVAFRDQNRLRFPDFRNQPVASFGALQAGLLIVGLAPGLKGANATGRPFTGDWAGDLLYATLLRHGFATGHYGEHAADGLVLVDCRVTNAVRCVPPGNRPTGGEAAQCRPFLTVELSSMPNLRVILAIGGFAHDAVLAARGHKKGATPFAHGAVHRLPDGAILVDSYHCSRLNTNTGRLTTAMFDAVIAQCRFLMGQCLPLHGLP